jgi:hypothetical protein
MSQIQFDVQGEIPVIAQPNSMACWATVTTMMMSWKQKQSFTIETAMDSLGSDFRKLFDENTGLAPERLQELATAAGMIIEYQKCETPDSILQLLQSYGPIRIGDDENVSAKTNDDPTSNMVRHARIIKGIYGDGDASNTYLKIIDPDGGRTYDELFKDFAAKYESLADDARYNVQMMHFPTSNDNSNSSNNASSGGNSTPQNVDFNYGIQLIPQPDKKTCWAASMAMIVGFRRKQSVTPQDLITEAGDSTWTETLVGHFGFVEIPLPNNTCVNEPPQQWNDWLTKYGPLWVTIEGDPSHAVVVQGIHGDLTPEGTTIDILNPWDVKTNFDADPLVFNPANNGLAQNKQPFNDFARSFADMAQDNLGNWRVLYLPEKPSN